MINKTILNRSLSIVVCIVWFTLLWIEHSSIIFALRMIPALLFPLLFIWFGDFLGSRLGLMGFGGSLTNVDTKTPGYLVAAAGWFFLVGIPVIAWMV